MVSRYLVNFREGLKLAHGIIESSIQSTPAIMNPNIPDTSLYRTITIPFSEAGTMYNVVRIRVRDHG